MPMDMNLILSIPECFSDFMNTQFIEFLAKSGAVKFGEFTLKSGRVSPYFISTGVIDDGSMVYELGKHYGKAIAQAFPNCAAIYGPAYKGIPLAVATAIAMQKELGTNKKWVFDRKEKKLHGDAGGFVGAEVDVGAEVVIVDDVMTTGATKLEAIEKIEKGMKAKAAGLVIAVDRQERGTKNMSAVQEFEEDTGVKVISLTTISDVFEHLKNKQIDGTVYIDDKIYAAFLAYRKKYGV